jgi:hypothetical protein
MKPEHGDIPELLEWLSRIAVIRFLMDPEDSRRYARVAHLLSEFSGVPMPGAFKKKRRTRGSPKEATHND